MIGEILTDPHTVEANIHHDIGSRLSRGDTHLSSPSRLPSSFGLHDTRGPVPSVPWGYVLSDKVRVESMINLVSSASPLM
jgi:hypothetical protein